MTLEEVTIQLMESNEKLNILHKDNTEIMEYLELSQNTFKEGYLQLIDFFKGSSLKELEEKREDNVYKEKLLSAIEDIELKTPEEKDKGTTSILGIAALIAGLIGVTIGVIAGWFKAIKEFAKLLSPKSIQAAASAALKTISDTFKAMGTVIANAVKAVRTSIITALSRFGAMFRIFDTAGSGRIAKIFANIGSRIREFATIFTNAGEVLRNMIRGPLKTIGTVFNTIRGYLRAFADVIGRVARIVGRLFAPVVAIMVIWDTVKGMIEGYNEEGIIGGIKGAITGFFNSLIFGPLDMIKDAAAWVLGKFGFKNAEEILKQFSFTELFTQLISGIFGFVTSAVNWVKDQLGFKDGEMPSMKDLVIGLLTAPYELTKQAVTWIAGKLGFNNAKEYLESFSVKGFVSDIVDSIIDLFIGAKDYIVGLFKSPGEILAGVVPDMDMAEEFIKSSLRSILPVGDENAKWYDVKNLVSKAIPNSVYRFAGIDPKTGKLLKEEEREYDSIVPAAIVRNEAINEEMNQATMERDMLRNQSLGLPPPPIVSNNSTVNATTNNNTSVFRPNPSPTRAPDAASGLFYSNMGYGVP